MADEGQIPNSFRGLKIPNPNPRAEELHGPYSYFVKNINPLVTVKTTKKRPIIVSLWAKFWRNFKKIRTFKNWSIKSFRDSKQDSVSASRRFISRCHDFQNIRRNKNAESILFQPILKISSTSGSASSWKNYSLLSKKGLFSWKRCSKISKIRWKSLIDCGN